MPTKVAANPSSRAAETAAKMFVRLIIWTFGVVLSFFPLALVALSLMDPNIGRGFLQAISNEELLAVAFTLGGVAAVDALIIARAAEMDPSARGPRERLRPFRVAVGLTTLLLTFFSIGIYLLLKFKATHWTPDATVLVVQILCVGTVITSFLCESRS